MAGAVRQALGPARKRLQEALTGAQELIQLPPEQMQYPPLRVMQMKIDKYSATYYRLYDQWLSFASGDKAEEEKTVADSKTHSDIIGNVDDASMSIDAILTAHAEGQRILAAPGGARAPIATPAAIPTVKLPKLQLPTFSGDILQWQSFWDCFKSAVHENQSISTIAKMNYLRAQLTGEAQRVIAGLAATSENYALAIQSLKDRFGNQDIVIAAHYNAIANLSPASNQKDRLRNVVDILEQHLNSLAALGEDVNTRQIIQTIKSKLPHGVLLRLEEQRGQEQWDAKTYRDRLHKFLAIREAVEHSIAQQEHATVPASRQVPPSTKPKYPSASSNHYSPRPPRSTTDTLFTSTRKPPCAFCGREDHWSDECPTYTTLDARKGRIKNKCSNCLGAGHRLSNCRRTKPCSYCKQVGRHHQSLCPTRYSQRPGNEASAIASAVASPDPPSISQLQISPPTNITEGSLMATSESALLQTAITTVQSSAGRNSTRARLLLDTGSQRTYVSEKLAKFLNLKTLSKDRLSICTFGATPPKEVVTSLVEIRIKLQNGEYFYLTANIVPTITGGIQRAPVDFTQLGPLHKLFPLADEFTSNDHSLEVDLLIGIDYYYDVVTAEKIQISNGLYLIGSRLGWLLSGRYESHAIKRSPLTTLFTHSITDRNDLSFSPADHQLTHAFDQTFLWDLETIGVKEPSDSASDEIALQKFNDTIQNRNGRYFVQWPWKDDNPDLPSNYLLSLGRLNSLLRRYRDQPKVLADYQAVFNQQIERGIIEKVQETSTASTLLHYIPHHAVLTPERTTKLRVVYDGSAKTKQGNMSLNDCLHRGPVMLEDVCALLIRFRLNSTAIIADIEKAFLQVGLQEADRDVTRFLWLKNTKLLTTDNNIQIYRFARVPFGIISSPFLLSATIAYHLGHDGSDIAKNILKNIYVDNILTGTASEAEALSFYSKTKEMFHSASMNVREWASNSSSFMQTVPSYDHASKTNQSVLGLCWNTVTDSLSIDPPKHEVQQCTKRSVLKYTASIFDPLGFFAPTTLLAKIFLQKLWLQKVDWDDIPPDSLCKEWELIASQMQHISSHRLARHINCQGDSPSFELHCFSDASQSAYGACIFLRVATTTHVSTHLLFAKARVAPVKGVTLPRLELLAVQIGARCLSFVEKSLPFSVKGKFLWTDSQCVLHWLTSKKPLTVFVRNRIEVIKRTINTSFRYVPTEENPADYASRGKSASDLIATESWWKGPSWLVLGESAWPSTLISRIETFDTDSSLPEESITASATLLRAQGAPLKKEAVTTIPSPFGIEATNYSSFTKLLRVTSRCCQFIRLLKRKQVHPNPVPSLQDIAHAKRLWIRYIQENEYSAVITAISTNNQHPLKTQLGLWLDSDGILRCGGRLLHADVPDSAKYPILLSKKGHLTELIIGDFHKKLFHAGVSHTLSQIRNEYWIPSGRSAVFKFVRHCRSCKRFDGGPFQLPKMPPLPGYRVTPSAAFTFTGLDYFGPLLIKIDGKPTTRKVWVCLFTCLATRAIHLEVVADMTASEFLLCLRRFIARRGKPSFIISDNAPQFKLVSAVIDKAWQRAIRSDDVGSYVSNEGIQWQFIVEGAPWKGGVYERLVRSIKQAMRKSIGKLFLTSTQLHTLMTEIEATLNSRPLTYPNADFPTGQPITPSHFLTLNPKTGVPPLIDGHPNDPDFIIKLSSKENVIQTWKKGQRHLDAFWKLWRDEYLLSLRERSQVFVKQTNRRLQINPGIGDIVLVHSDGPRGTWKLARIIKLITSPDGAVRSAEILTSNGNTTRRSLMHLYPLECDTPRVDSDTIGHSQEQIVRPPQRAAAKRAQERIRAYSDEDDD